jgi:hypothetical protein
MISKCLTITAFCFTQYLSLLGITIPTYKLCRVKTQLINVHLKIFYLLSSPRIIVPMKGSIFFYTWIYICKLNSTYILSRFNMNTLELLFNKLLLPLHISVRDRLIVLIKNAPKVSNQVIAHCLSLLQFKDLYNMYFKFVY